MFQARLFQDLLIGQYGIDTGNVVGVYRFVEVIEDRHAFLIQRKGRGRINGVQNSACAVAVAKIREKLAIIIGAAFQPPFKCFSTLQRSKVMNGNA